MTLSRRSIPLVALCLSFVALVAFPDPGAAQEGRAHSLKPGAWALQFSVLDDFRLGSFEGSILSIKRHSSAHSAFRLGVSGSLSGSDQSSADSTAFLVDHVFTDVNLRLQYVHYPRPGSDVNLFLAVGPEFGLHRLSATEDQGVNERKTKDRSWSAGIEGLLGVEWFPIRMVGVHAEYGVKVAFSTNTLSHEFSDPAITDVEVESDRWVFAGTGVAFGASVYF